MPVDISGVMNTDSPSGPLARAQFPGKRILLDPSIACGQHLFFTKSILGQENLLCHCLGTDKAGERPFRVPKRQVRPRGGGEGLSLSGGGGLRSWALEAATWAPPLTN